MHLKKNDFAVFETNNWQENHNISSVFEWFMSSGRICHVLGKRGRWVRPLQPEDCACEPAAQRGCGAGFRSRGPSPPVPAAVQRRCAQVAGTPPTENGSSRPPAWGACVWIGCNKSELVQTGIHFHWGSLKHLEEWFELSSNFRFSPRLCIQTLLQRSPPASCLRPSPTTGHPVRSDRWLIACFHEACGHAVILTLAKKFHLTQYKKCL